MRSVLLARCLYEVAILFCPALLLRVFVTCDQRLCLTGWGLCDWLWNLIKACRYKLFPRNGRHARIGAIQPLEVHVRNITQMFWIIWRWAWFYTSPVSVCRFGAAPVVHMCMTKMNHQAHLTKFPHLGWSASGLQLQCFELLVFQAK